MSPKADAIFYVQSEAKQLAEESDNSERQIRYNRALAALGAIKSFLSDDEYKELLNTVEVANSNSVAKVLRAASDEAARR